MKVGGLFGLFLLTSTFPATGADVAASEALVAARAKWTASSINSYEIRFRDEACFCLFGPYHGPIRNVVRRGKLHVSYYEGERRDGYSHGRRVHIASNLRATVEDVFSMVESLLATAPEGAYRVEYDPTYGFPALVDFDDPTMDDEQWRLVADGFRPMSARR
jgi:hypothetical protein